MFADVHCPKCGGLATERKSRSKGAKDRFRCFGKKWSKGNYKDGVLISTTSGYIPSCGLFGIKDLSNAEEK